MKKNNSRLQLALLELKSTKPCSGPAGSAYANPNPELTTQLCTTKASPLCTTVCSFHPNTCQTQGGSFNEA